MVSADLPGRNEPCHCGSGRKFKRCCALGTTADRSAAENASFDFGLAAENSGKPELAAHHYRRVLAINPENVQALINLGNMLSDLRQHAEALETLAKAQRLAPHIDGLHLNLAVAYQAAGRLPEAIAYCRRAVAAMPRSKEARATLTTMLKEAGNLDNYVQALAESVEAFPDSADFHAQYGGALVAVGRPADAVQFHRRAVALEPDKLVRRSALIGAMMYLPDLDDRELQAELNAFEQAAAARAQDEGAIAVPALSPSGRGDRLRIGYVSADLREHSVAYFIEPVLEAHDRTRVEIFAYSNSAEEDYVTARIKSHCEHWRACSELSEQELERLIRADGIDILIDLSGHTAGHRLGVFARRPAPIQLSWLGFPCRTGLRGIAGYIGDALVTPTGEDAAVKLEPTFNCYRPSQYASEVATAPVLKNRYITFGSFNNLAKLSEPAVGLWSRVLTEVPASRLLLKSRGLEGEITAAWVKSRFEGHGVDPERLQFLPRDESLDEHFRQYSLVDIGLDPFPYCGVTTTCEALWMGVPVVSLVGHRFAARTGLTLLSAIGHPEWAASSEDGYVEQVKALCASPDELALVRASLRSRIADSPLMDARGLTRNLETALIALAAGEHSPPVERWTAG